MDDMNLQMFAEGDEGGASGMPRPTDATIPSVKENLPPQERYRAGQGKNDNTPSECALSGGTAAAEGRNVDTNGKRDLSATSAGGTLGAQGGASGGKRPTGATDDLPPQERYRAGQGSNENTPAECVLNHFRWLEGEAERMREVFPEFDLRRELRDPRFAALTAPGTGIGVEDAYYAIHRRELQAASMQVAARLAAQKIASAIQSSARRPVESGAGLAAPAALPLKNMSREQREQLRQRIRTAAAMGEKVFP